MSVTRTEVLAAAKPMAQDAGNPPLLANTGDYDQAINQAIELFSVDRPNLRTYHHAVTTAAFRFVLLGTGVVLPTTGLDKWVDGASQVKEIFVGYDTAVQGGNLPLDHNRYRVIREPGPKIVLELLDVTPANETLRVEYVTPHVVDAAAAASTSLLSGDVPAFEILTAHFICKMAATKYAQNTGTTGFGVGTDVVDRRSQSDVMSSRAKALLDTYNGLVGRDSSSDVPGAAAIRKMEIPTTHGRGRLWAR